MNNSKSVLAFALILAIFSGSASAQSLTSLNGTFSNSAEEKKEEEKQKIEVEIDSVIIKGQKYIRIKNNSTKVFDFTVTNESGQPVASVRVLPGTTEHIPVASNQNLNLSVPISVSESAIPMEAAPTPEGTSQPTQADVALGYQATPEFSTGGMDYSIVGNPVAIVQSAPADVTIGYQASPGVSVGATDYSAAGSSVRNVQPAQAEGMLSNRTSTEFDFGATNYPARLNPMMNWQDFAY